MLCRTEDPHAGAGRCNAQVGKPCADQRSGLYISWHPERLEAVNRGIPSWRRAVLGVLIWTGLVALAWQVWVWAHQ